MSPSVNVMMHRRWPDHRSIAFWRRAFASSCRVTSTPNLPKAIRHVAIELVEVLSLDRLHVLHLEHKLPCLVFRRQVAQEGIDLRIIENQIAYLYPTHCTALHSGEIEMRIEQRRKQFADNVFVTLIRLILRACVDVTKLGQLPLCETTSICEKRGSL